MSNDIQKIYIVYTVLNGVSDLSSNDYINNLIDSYHKIGDSPLTR